VQLGARLGWSNKCPSQIPKPCVAGCPQPAQIAECSAALSKLIPFLASGTIAAMSWRPVSPEIVTACSGLAGEHPHRFSDLRN